MGALGIYRNEREKGENVAIGERKGSKLGVKREGQNLAQLTNFWIRH